MAKKKKRRSGKRRGKKRAAPKKDRAVPLGMGAGALVSGSKVLLAPNAAGSGPVTYLMGAIKAGVPLGDALATTVDKFGVALTDLNKYYPALGGALVSASPKIPVLSLIARPADKAVRRLTKGKVSL